MLRRRRPLLRAAAVGGGAYVAGKRRAQRQAEEQQAAAYQDARISQLEQQQAAPPARHRHRHRTGSQAQPPDPRPHPSQTSSATSRGCTTRACSPTRSSAPPRRRCSASDRTATTRPPWRPALRAVACNVGGQVASIGAWPSAASTALSGVQARPTEFGVSRAVVFRSRRHRSLRAGSGRLPMLPGRAAARAARSRQAPGRHLATRSHARPRKAAFPPRGSRNRPPWRHLQSPISAAYSPRCRSTATSGPPVAGELRCLWIFRCQSPTVHLEFKVQPGRGVGMVSLRC